MSGALAAASLLKGQAALSEAKTALSAGDLEAASASFDAAQAAFGRVHGGPQGLILRVAGFVPWAGNSADATLGLGVAGDDLARAGSTLLGSIDTLPGGIDSLAPAGGQLPLDALQSLEPAAAAADRDVQHAVRTLEALPRSLLLPPLGSGVAAASDATHQAATVVTGISASLEALPAYLGADGDRTYIVVAENPAEIRGTGGFIGEFALLKLRGGRPELTPFRDIKSINYADVGDKRSHRVAPPASANQIFEPGDVPETGVPSYFGQSLLSQPVYTNTPPRAADAATLLQDVLGRDAGIEADGVIFVTPQALPFLMRATGPIQSRDLGVALNAENVVAFTTNGAYSSFGDSAARKEALGEAAHEVWEAFLRANSGDNKLKALAGAAASGSLALTSNIPAEQAAFDRAGIGGSWGPPQTGGDFGGTVLNNYAGNKVDFYLHPVAEYDVQLLADGSSRTTVIVTLRNGAPKGAKPSYVLGPYQDDYYRSKLDPGDTVMGVAQYCATKCQQEYFAIDGKEQGAQSEPDGNATLIGTYVTLHAQETKTFEYTYLAPDTWGIEHGRGSYRLRLQAPSTIHPLEATVTVHAPDGTTVLSAGGPKDVSHDGRTVTWTGQVQKWIDLDVVFDKSFVGKLWDQLW